MKLEKSFTAFLAVFVILSLTYMFLRNPVSGVGITAETLVEENQKLAPTLTFDPKTTGSTRFSDALVELTPVVVDGNEVVLRFKINTHSVRLSKFDLEQITTLEYEEKVLKPVRASRLGGHHSSGEIIFTVGEDIRNFTIRIKGIPKVQERVYTWNVG